MIPIYANGSTKVQDLTLHLPPTSCVMCFLLWEINMRLFQLVNKYAQNIKCNQLF